MTVSASKSVPRVVFSADQLPEELDDNARYRLWRDVYNATFVELDYKRLEDQPFSADLQYLQFGPVGFAQFSSTVSQLVRSKAHIAAQPTDSIAIALVGEKPLLMSHAGHELMHRPGGTTLTIECESMVASCPEGSDWLLLKIPHEVLRERVANVEDLVATAVTDTPAARHLRNYASHLLRTDVENDPMLVRMIGDHLLDLAALTLGARGDAAELAGRRGLRGARLREIMQEIEAHFCDPAISARVVGLKLGLSPRYVNDLLQEAGTTFTERVLELRLQRARAMLSDPRHDRLRIGEIAAVCGFNDVSYFNRCFRRRFGDAPGAFRGGGR